MANEMMGMWGANDLNDLIRGLKMVLAQAEDVRACGGTLADLKEINTCGTSANLKNANTCNNRTKTLTQSQYESGLPLDYYEEDYDRCEGCTDNCYECDDYWGDSEKDDNEDDESTENYVNISGLEDDEVLEEFVNLLRNYLDR